MQKQVCHVLDVDPGHPLIPRSKPASQSQPESRQHEWKRALSAKYHRHSDGHDTDAKTCRAHCLRFPGDCDATEKTRAADRGLFAQFLLTSTGIDVHS